ncbi:MAG TPA: copper oxidase [Blastocatellia bacterium]|nr:copper oxidase [Blastocatellia bacterium]
MNRKSRDRGRVSAAPLNTIRQVARLSEAGSESGYRIAWLLLLWAVVGASAAAQTTAARTAAPPRCANVISADVVALEQVYIYNRFGAFNPEGMLYALRQDVVDLSGRPIGDGGQPGRVMLRPDKRPRPLVLRVNEGDCLRVRFTNLLAPSPPNGSLVIPDPPDPNDGSELVIEREHPATRQASIHVNGLEYADNIQSDASNVGLNPSSLAAPGETRTYTWYARKTGGYLFHSIGAISGGEGDGGQVGLGLFGTVNVEPRGSKWYRSQVTHAQLQRATVRTNPDGTPVINYAAVDPDGKPTLNLLKGNQLVHSDLNAIIVPNPAQIDCTPVGPGTTCGEPYREFTVIFHDEIRAVQAFGELEESSIKDGFAINYGASGMGAITLANRVRIGPNANCQECKLEEFFLTSWANGDPALIVTKNEQGRATANKYPDDPSNVHHSYINDPTRFINLHAGPKETHVFHLHAHQWVFDSKDDNSTYLDSQTISPGASFIYDIHHGGSGNRNLLPGDAIFHCHLYPHFAQGMWELWRNHDVFEDGTPGLFSPANPKGRNLPDGEIAEGTSNPAVIPLPGRPMPPMPKPEFRGFPFYIPAEAGHRPPQAPLDIAVENGVELNGGLPRHVITRAEAEDGKEAVPEELLTPRSGPECDADLYEKGKCFNATNAARVSSENGSEELFDFARTLVKAELRFLPQTGTPAERTAMRFHCGNRPGCPRDGVGLGPTVPAPTRFGWPARGYNAFDSTGRRGLFRVNGLTPQPGAPYANPCRPGARDFKYRAAYLQFDLTVNKVGWHDPQARIALLERDLRDTLSGARPAEPLFFRANSDSCVEFRGTNLVPNVLNLDDFQVFSPTDTIGQHIHLVKFDVTSSDGAGNGWNYEDGTFAADEVRERIAAYNQTNPAMRLRPRTHPIFLPGGALAGDRRGLCGDQPGGSDENPWCGAQSTIQRWWADPLLNNRGQDRTLRTVFTHDHFGPSSHQHHGLYAALIVEQKNARWRRIDGREFGQRDDGGPTSAAANILLPNSNDNRREYNLAFADFAIVYSEDNRPINPPNRVEEELPKAIGFAPLPAPEAISAADPGTQLINYRNEPIPLRIGEKGSDGKFRQKDGAQGDLVNVFSSTVHANSFPNPKIRFPNCADPQTSCVEADGARQPGDPATPLLTAHEGDRVQLQLIQGAQEEQHVFNLHGMKWLAESASARSGLRNSQEIGISEHFEFDVLLNKDGDDTDHLYSSSATDNLWDGMWGLLRVIGVDRSNPQATFDGRIKLAPLYPQKTIRMARAAVRSAAADACPAGVPLRQITVSAWRARDLLPDRTLPYRTRRLGDDPLGINDPNAIIYIRDSERYLPRPDAAPITILPSGQLENELRQGLRSPEPLVLRAAANDCIQLTLRNRLPQQLEDGPNFPGSWSWNLVPPIVDGFNFNQVRMSAYVSLHPQLVGVRTFNADSANVGLNQPSAVAPGANRGFNWYAGDRRYNATKDLIEYVPAEFGATALRDMADVIKHSSHGAIGALIIEPQGSTWREDPASSATADVFNRLGRQLFREFAVLYQDDLSLRQHGVPMPNLRETDDSEDSGRKAFNYRMEPIWGRLGVGEAADPNVIRGLDLSNVFSSRVANHICAHPPCDPATPIFRATAGSEVRFRVVHPAGHPRQHGFTIHGHNWFLKPWNADSTRLNPAPISIDFVGSQSGIGPTRHINILTTAGGRFAVPGDYLYRTQESLQILDGLWGIFRIERPTGGPSAAPAGRSTGDEKQQ